MQTSLAFQVYIIMLLIRNKVGNSPFSHRHRRFWHFFWGFLHERLRKSMRSNCGQKGIKIKGNPNPVSERTQGRAEVVISYALLTVAIYKPKQDIQEQIARKYMTGAMQSKLPMGREQYRFRLCKYSNRTAANTPVSEFCCTCSAWV